MVTHEDMVDAIRNTTGDIVFLTLEWLGEDGPTSAECPCTVDGALAAIRGLQEYRDSRVLEEVLDIVSFDDDDLF